MDLYRRISKKPRNFQQLTGLKHASFQQIVCKLKPIWAKTVANKKIKSGRPYALGYLENQLLALLLYYRFYTTQAFIGYFFRVDDATICRNIKRLEPMLARILAIKKARNLSTQQLETILLDCTEQPIQRPQKQQRKFYSGKKKLHSIKTEIQINGEGRIINLSKPAPGSVHDFSVRKQHDALPVCAKVLADSGYQGLRAKHKKSKIPIKKTKKEGLTANQRLYNKLLSKRRIKVEHKIGELKTFRIIGDKYRNKLGSYHVKMNIVAGLVNIRSGF